MRSKGFESGKPRRCKNIEATRGAAAHSGLHTQLLQRTIYVNAVRVCYENNTFHTGHHHLRIGPYKGSVNSVQNQMPFRYSAVLDAPSALRAAHKLLVFRSLLASLPHPCPVITWVQLGCPVVFEWYTVFPRIVCARSISFAGFNFCAVNSRAQFNSTAALQLSAGWTRYYHTCDILWSQVFRLCYGSKASFWKSS